MSLAELQPDKPEFAAREVPVNAELAPPSQSAVHDVESGKTDDTTESIFSLKEKWLVVSLASLAAFFRCVLFLSKKTCQRSRELARTVTCSPFTANIYLPVIPAVSRDFHKSIELINLTVTMYMIFQGICA
jgi:hypothetical protein